MDKTCNSCSGPLGDYKEDEIKNGLCPYCADESGNLKSYKDILEVMIGYIRDEHPEITEDLRKKTAKEWLREGPIWGQLWTGLIKKESLKTDSVLEKLKIVDKIEEGSFDKDSNNDPINWITYKIEFYRTDLSWVRENLENSLKKKPAGCVILEAPDKNEICVVFAGKSFRGHKSNEKYMKKINDYAKLINVELDL